MTVQVNIGGTDITADLLWNSVSVKFVTEDDEHYYGINSVSLSVSNMNGVRNDLLTMRRTGGAVHLEGLPLMSVIVETVSEDRDNETIALTLMARDREIIDKLKALKLVNYGQDYQGLWTLFEGAAQYRVWTRVDKILERALDSIGVALNWDVTLLTGYNLVLGGLSPDIAKGIGAPRLLADLPIIGKIYHPQKDHLPDWDVAALLAEVSQVFNLYWTVIDGTLHIKDMTKWSILTGAGVSLPLIQGSAGIEYGESNLGRVKMTFANAMPEGRQAPAGTVGVVGQLGGSDNAKEVTSKFALTYSLSGDYGVSLGNVAVLPQGIEDNRFIVLTSGVDWDQQHPVTGEFCLLAYSPALHEVGNASAKVSAMDDPDLVIDLSLPYVKVALPANPGETILVREATFNPHEETVELSAAVYQGIY